MRYYLQPDRHCIRIHVRQGEIGYVELPCESYAVRDPTGETVAVVNSLADALPALLDYHEKEKRRSGAYRFLPLLPRR
jgi:hypothetical protein